MTKPSCYMLATPIVRTTDSVVDTTDNAELDLDLIRTGVPIFAKTPLHEAARFNRIRRSGPDFLLTNVVGGGRAHPDGDTGLFIEYRLMSKREDTTFSGCAFPDVCADVAPDAFSCNSRLPHDDVHNFPRYVRMLHASLRYLIDEALPSHGWESGLLSEAYVRAMVEGMLAGGRAQQIQQLERDKISAHARIEAISTLKEEFSLTGSM